MLFRKKLILGVISLSTIVMITLTTEAAGGTNGIKVSGGEHHSLVLPEDKFVWGCGANSAYQLGIGDDKIDRSTLILIYEHILSAIICSIRVIRVLSILFHNKYPDLSGQKTHLSKILYKDRPSLY